MADAPNRTRVYVGPSGWSYPDWRGVVYPAGAPRGFDHLAYLSTYFDAIEINTSFYRPPAARMTASWVRRVEPRPRFRFACKLWQRFTHERGEDYAPAEARTFRDGIAPLVEAGRLGCLLMQFPWSFRNTDESMNWLARLAESFGEQPLVVEPRHASWDRDEVRRQLADLGINYCNIDQPALRDCLGPAAHATGPVGYVRFHGRRRDTWFADNVPSHARYDYLYRREELEEWVSRIAQLAERTDEVYVFTNNHYRGQGPANALQLRAMLEGGQLDVPPDMLQHFPFLKDVADEPSLRRVRPARDDGATLFDP